MTDEKKNTKRIVFPPLDDYLGKVPVELQIKIGDGDWIPYEGSDFQKELEKKDFRVSKVKK